MTTSHRLVPDHRPRMDEAEVLAVVRAAILNDPGIIDPAQFDARHPVKVFMSRGYFPNTFGRKGVNDRGFYDDGAALIVGDRMVATYNANCDPVRAGWNKGVDKFFAQLKRGVWPWRQGTHRGRPRYVRQLTDEDALLALLGRWFKGRRALGEFIVERLHVDGHGEEEWGYQAINGHEGGETSTQSWGCQTWEPSQFPGFRDAAYDAIGDGPQSWAHHGIVPLILSERRIK